MLGYANRAAPLSVASGLSARAAALIGRMTVRPSRRRARFIDKLYADLGDTILAKLDVLYILAAHDEQTSRLNWAQIAYDLTAANTPAFTVDRGWQADGSTQYLTSGWTQLVADARFTTGNCCMGLWALTSTRNGTSTCYEIGYNGQNTKSFIARNTSVSEYVAYAARRPGSSGNLLLGGSLADHVAWSRYNTDQIQTYRSGVVTGDPTDAIEGGTVGSAEFRVCGAGNNYGTNQIAAGYWGAALTAGEMLILDNALRAYLIAVGAVAP